MTQRNRTLAQMVVLAVVALGLGLFAYFGVHKSDEREAKQKDHDERLFSPQNVDEKDVDGGSAEAEFTKVTVNANGESTVVERAPGKLWRITSPVKALADPVAIDALVSQLQTQKFKRKLEEAPDAETLKRYGLAPPQFTVEAIAEVGSAKAQRTVKLMGGVENTFDGSVYMRREGDQAVYQAEGGVRFSLQKTTFDLREKAVLGVEADNVIKVAFKSTDNTWELERIEGVWHVTKPYAAAADANLVEGILGGLRSEQAQKFPEDTPANRSRLGVDSAAIDATFTLKDGGSVRLRVTRPKGDAGTAPHVLREDAEGAVLAELMSSSVGGIDRNANDLRNKAVLSFKQAEVQALVARTADGQELVAERERIDGGFGNAWVMTSPRQGPAKTMSIASYLWSLGAYKYSVIVDERPKDLAQYGLDRKARFIALRDANGKELARLTVGKEVPGEAPAVYALGSLVSVVKIDGSMLAQLPFTLEALAEGAVAPGDAGLADASVE